MPTHIPADSRKKHLGFNQSYAIVIGIDTYTELKPLKNAVQDAIAIAMRLKVMQGFDHVLLLTDTTKVQFDILLWWLEKKARQSGAAAIPSNLFDAQTKEAPIGWLTLKGKYDKKKDKKLHPVKEDAQNAAFSDIWLSREVQLDITPEKDSIVFYYAGHGLEDRIDDGPTGFLAPADCTYDSSTQIPMSEIYFALSGLNCLHTLLILDCCFAGKFKFSTTTRGNERSYVAPLYKRRLKRFQESKAWQVLVSAGPEQLANDSARWADLREHSPFAASLKKALAGAADRNHSPNRSRQWGDGLIQAKELREYIWDEVERWTGNKKPQHPDLYEMGQHQDGEFIFLNPAFPFDPKKLPKDPDLNPYMGLKPYEEKHAHLFFGRERVVQQVIDRLRGNNILFVTGPSGSGKSSLIKAGVFPALKDFKCQSIRPSELADSKGSELQDSSCETEEIIGQFHNEKLDALLIDQFEEVFTHPDREWLQRQMFELFRRIEHQATLHLSQVAKDIGERLTQEDLQILFFNGPHGSGKSQLIETHVLPELEGKGYQPHIVRPGEYLEKDSHSFDKLIKEASSSGRHIIFIDQYEEIFQYPNKNLFELSLAKFIRENKGKDVLILVAVQSEFDLQVKRSPMGEFWTHHQLFQLPPRKPLIILTMRSDFEWQLNESTMLTDSWTEKSLCRVPPMDQNELRKAITGPAWWAMYDFQDKEKASDLDAGEKIINKIIEDVAYAPGALPLLSFTMQSFYELAKGKERRLLFKDYIEVLKGVEGALSKRADDFFEELSETEQNLMKKIFLRMVDVNDGDFSSRRVIYSEHPDTTDRAGQPILSELDFQNQQEILNGLIKKLGEGEGKVNGAQLIIQDVNEKGEPYIEPLHEALILYWGRCRKWIDEFGIDNLLLHKKLREAVSEYYFPEEQEVKESAAQETSQNRSIEVYKEEQTEKKGLIKKKPQATLWHNNPRLLPLKASLRESKHLKKELKRAKSKRKREKERGLFTTQSQKQEKAEAKLKEKKFEFNVWEKRFIEESIRKQNKRWRNIAYIVSSVMVALLSLSVLAWIQRAEANKQRDVAEAKSLAFQSNAYLGSDPTLALQTAMQAIEKDDQSPTIQRALMEAFYTPIIDKELFYQQKLQHQRAIKWAAFSPQENQFLTASDDTWLKIWDFNGNCLDSLAHPGSVYRADFSPNGQLVGSSSGDSIYLWKPGQGLLTSWKAHAGRVTTTSVNFSPNGKFLLSSSSGGEIVIWDLASDFPIPQKVKEIKAHQENVLSATFSPDGRFILTSSADSTAKLWDTSGVMRTSFVGHEGMVLSASFSPSGSSVLTASADGQVILWDTSGDTSKIIQHPIFPKTAYFSNDGQLILTSCEDKMARIYDPDGEVKYILKGHLTEVRGAFFSPDNDWVLTISSDQTARLWNLNAQEKFIDWYHADGNISQGIFSPNDDFILLMEEVGKAYLWRTDKTDFIDLEGIDDYNFAADFTSDGETFLVGSGYNVHLWKNNGTQQERSFKITQNYDARKIAMFSPVHSTILTASTRDSVVSLWDTQGDTINHIPHQHLLMDARFSPKGNILSATNNYTGFVWTPEGELLDSFPLPKDSVRQLNFSPDEKNMLVVFKGKNEALYWPISRGDTVRLTHGAPIYSADMLEKNQITYILTASEDGTAKLWNEKGNLIFEYNNQLISAGHQEAVGVKSASLSHNGHYILVSTESKKAVLLLTPLGVAEQLKSKAYLLSK
jgi:WD40 repeat protein